MKPQKLAYPMLLSTGLFAMTYLAQKPLMAVLGVRQTATLIVATLIVTAILAAFSIYVLRKLNHNGLVAYGLITLFITIVLILTRLQFAGLFLFVLYCGVVISRFFKYAEEERRARAIARKNAQPPADLPL